MIILIKIVLLRHGESVWNKENRFTGWTDVDLSPRGYDEAKKAGQTLKDEGYIFDIAFTSVLKRGIRTLWIVLDIMDLLWIPVLRSWRLNERMYGALQGLYKSEMAKKMGEEQVLIWRRSYDIPPPALNSTDPRSPGYDIKYQNLNPNDIPLTESLKDTIERVMPYFDQISEEDIVKLNIPTGIPLVYELDDNLKPIKHYYLAKSDEVEKAIQAVADQGKAR